LVGVALVVVVADGDHDDDAAGDDGQREGTVEKKGVEQRSEDDRAWGGCGLRVDGLNPNPNPNSKATS